MDDIVITGTNEEEIDEVVKKLCQTFKCRDMGKLSFFLGIQCIYQEENIVL